MTNNEYRVPEDLQGSERDLFAHYMLGATSDHVDPQTWQRLYQDAHTYVLNHRAALRQDQPVSQNGHS